MSDATHHTQQASPIQVTNSAIAKVYDLIKEEGNPQLKLRAFITGGGCSGLQYGFSFDERKNEDDFEFTNQGRVNNAAIEIKLLVDAQSFPYLKGAEIDYRKDIHGEQFIIRNNPNTKTTCGCGSSFSAE